MQHVTVDDRVGGWSGLVYYNGPEPNIERLRQLLERKRNEYYERGFTTQGGALWIGNEILHVLTSFPDNQQVLRIELTRKAGQQPTVVYYNKFHVGSKKERYKLTIGDYHGPPGYDALSYHNGAEFTIKESMTQTPDKDKCSDRLSGGWWFRTCNEANLNGRKFKSPSSTRALGITWHIEDKPESYKYIYDRVEMKIRDDDFGFCTGAVKFKIR
uniref:Putative ficolin/ixoderin n=1 Tax=Ixodes ricinus TaxID=34613 RepID=A0A0K8RKT0_IXORI